MSRSAPPVALELRTSRLHLAALIVAALLAVAAVHLAGLALVLRIALEVLVAVAAMAGAARAMRWNGARLTVFEDQPARLRDTQGREIEATLKDATLLGPLIALHLAPSGGRALHLALLPDSAHADDLRRLRVLLRHGVKFGRIE